MKFFIILNNFENLVLCSWIMKISYHNISMHVYMGNKMVPTGKEFVSSDVPNCDL